MGLFIMHPLSEVPTKESLTKVIITNLELFLEEECEYEYLVTCWAKQYLDDLIEMIEREKQNEN